VNVIPRRGVSDESVSPAPQARFGFVTWLAFRFGGVVKRF
jgi:hypothetical protein